MNKTDLITTVHNELRADGITRATIESVADTIGRVAAQHLASADPHCDAEVTLPGLGKLKTSTRAARTGRNPQNGAEIQIPERVAVKFQAGKALDEALNA